MRFQAALWMLVCAAPAAGDEITRVWLTHQSTDTSKIVVNWESSQPGNSVVHFAAMGKPLQTIAVEESVTLHHVEIPLREKDTKYRYSVETGDERSAEAEFKAYPTDVLRMAIVADWGGRKMDLVAILADDVHLLLTAGDNISALHGRCGPGVRDCTKPYGELVAAHPRLFASVPFMPALGNHDREIRSRGGKSPPAEAVYDVDATAYRKFFALPGDEWKWHFDVPDFGLRFVALDLNHIQDLGTTWQSSHPYDRASEQFRWYERVMAGPKPPFVVTLHNEQNSSMRSKEDRQWHQLFRRGTIAVSGFGYFAERAEVDGFTYYNTALGAGDKYADGASKFLAVQASYLLLTVEKEKMTVEIKELDGSVLDRKEFGKPY
jgi:hypothetical protein